MQLIKDYKDLATNVERLEWVKATQGGRFKFAVFETADFELVNLEPDLYLSFREVLDLIGAFHQLTIHDRRDNLKKYIASLEDSEGREEALALADRFHSYTYGCAEQLLPLFSFVEVVAYLALLASAYRRLRVIPAFRSFDAVDFSEFKQLTPAGFMRVQLAYQEVKTAIYVMHGQGAPAWHMWKLLRNNQPFTLKNGKQ